MSGKKLSKDKGGMRADETLFKQLVGSLMYLIVTRPDLMYDVSLISRFMTSPTLACNKKNLTYVKRTTGFGIFYKKGESNLTSGFVFMMGFGVVSWSSKKQTVVALSTTEAEYIVATLCACQCVWLRRLLEKIRVKEKTGIVVMCDNNSTIQLSKNPVFHGENKHIDVRFHFLRDLVNDGVIKLSHCNSQDQLANIMTKPLKLE
uniref:Retrovirus-related Pol polyprotein from transposon TNT 1-94 n=1 Tax=Cajanus cajan TaxID=3821 RepID=A0A151U0U0_CAJCA|nr:Retrovirus-related Pol polyprotein from transposon TNT 1-94 [Cajanus cajan]